MDGSKPVEHLPSQKEAHQYVTYSAKELLHILHAKVDKIDDKVDELKVNFASLPATYVTQEQVQEARKESAMAKRFAVASIIASVGALGTYLGLFL